MKKNEENVNKEIEQLLIENNPVRAVIIATTELGWTFEEAIFKLPEKYEELYQNKKVKIPTKEYWRQFYS